MRRETQRRPRGTSAPAPTTAEQTLATLADRVHQLELRVGNIDRALEGATQRRAREGHSGFWLRDKGSDLMLARHAAGWTQAGLAAALECNKTTISLWETDKQDIPLWRAKQIVQCFEANEATPPAWSFVDEAG